MGAQPQDTQAILTRIEALERQNRRLKLTAASGLLFLAVALLSAFQAGKPANPVPLNAAKAAYSSAAKECTTDYDAADYEQTCLAKAALALPNTQAKLNFLALAVDYLWYAQVKEKQIDARRR
jgi:hypothetical protein